MEAGWGSEFIARFEAFETDAIATVLTRDNREFFAHRDEIEVLDTFPSAWLIQRRYVIPESEIIRVEISGAIEDR